MILIVCLDDRDGMLFGGKRLSRDRTVCEKILAVTAGSKLWMSGYSAKLFAEYAADILVDELFLERAQHGEFCFLEDRDILPYADKVEQIILFRWNRHYPADKRFSLDLTATPWKQVRIEEFPGNSHEKITMEVYTR